MNFSHLLYDGRSDVGRTREHNEDAFVMLPEDGVFCVADGMGGAEGGELASRAVVDAIEREFSSLNHPRDAARCSSKAELVQKALNHAAQWIVQYAASKSAKGMGTTVVVLLLDSVFPDKALVLHAGDSRLYRYRQGGLEQITTDHSLAAATGVEDEELLNPSFRAIITRAVGIQKTVDLESTPVDLEKDDILLLCSDGLTKMLPDKELLNLFHRNANSDISELAQILIDGANMAGGKDNITAILVNVGEAAPCGDRVATDDTKDEEEDTSETVFSGADKDDDTSVPTAAMTPVVIDSDTDKDNTQESASSTTHQKTALTMDRHDVAEEPTAHVATVPGIIVSTRWVLLFLVLATILFLFFWFFSSVGMDLNRTVGTAGQSPQKRAAPFHDDVEQMENDRSRITELMTIGDEPDESQAAEPRAGGRAAFDEEAEPADNDTSRITELMNMEN